MSNPPHPHRVAPVDFIPFSSFTSSSSSSPAFTSSSPAFTSSSPSSSSSSPPTEYTLNRTNKHYSSNTTALILRTRNAIITKPTAPPPRTITPTGATRPTPIFTSRNLPLLVNSKSGGASCPQGSLPAMTSPSSSTDLYDANRKMDDSSEYDPRGNSSHYHHQSNTSLPSPPLSSMTPTTPYSSHSHLRTNFSPKTLSLSSTSPSSPPSSHYSLQERCDALQAELSSLRIQLQQQEQTSTVREKRLSQYQQQSSNTQVSLQTLKHQHELVLAQLSKTQTDTSHLRNQLDTTSAENRQLKTQVQEQKRELREVTLDRDSLSLEMVECHSDNAKFLRRLRGSTDMLGSLQDENRSLIEQLRELRARVTELTEDRSKLSETLERERQRTSQATLGLEAIVTRYKDEVERLQDLVLAMGHKHVQTQTQLSFLQKIQQQQHQQKQQQQAIQTAESTSPSSHSKSSAGDHSSKALVHHQKHPSESFSTSSTLHSLIQSHSSTQPLQQTSHGGLVLGDGALASILSSVAASSNSRRFKPTRRFTINGAAQQQQQQKQDTPLTLEQRKTKFLMDQITVLQRGYDNIRQEKITLELQLDQVQRQYEYQQQQRQRRRSSQRRTLGSEQRQLISVAPVPPPPPVPSIPQQHSQQPHQQHQQHHHKKHLQHHHQKQPSLSSTIKLPDGPPPQIKTEEEEIPPVITANMTKEERAEAERIQQQIQEALAALESKRRHNHEVPLAQLSELKHLETLKFPQEEEKKPASSPKPQQHQNQLRLYDVRLDDIVDWGVQQCSCCIGNLIEI
ncbi:MAG: hypothetical protein JOS17DRAFT_755582 [Linnemannia elongata]|nr:MAG: hypothetical protein JOS17DRAFT_755582 [Linnemannia elongata]